MNDSKDLKDLTVKLKKDPVAKEKFIADMLVALKNQGIDTNDPEVLKTFDLDAPKSPNTEGLFVLIAQILVI
ncbi:MULTISPECIES: hypothetical protein [Psychrilyobacter]|uniref:Uncharacterized protein n=1 Tax=Psychrilyobacter piezotolerans TaxID=2293438 RepID=A0ABX9KDF4_9FUSO|nr:MULTISPECIES: hypothetical protein [Psychrilyobacter]MCS5422425.1 hypothetical protein [Psychrilyobacter sp. S5]NDI79057.1 hypothetical protein [Psychrilyobacter piezotolerans]RDE59018.1 hypothetical protein DV867_14165 [Psychrilyobacter sp. S5]REI39595.1 hypothetical protein DYH56_14165 [Psychrilyobacter piezotolerans]